MIFSYHVSCMVCNSDSSIILTYMYILTGLCVPRNNSFIGKRAALKQSHNFIMSNSAMLCTNIHVYSWPLLINGKTKFNTVFCNVTYTSSRQISPPPPGEPGANYHHYKKTFIIIKRFYVEPTEEPCTCIC